MSGRGWRKRDAVLWAVALLVYLFLLGPIAVVFAASLEAKSTYYFTFPPTTLTLAWYAGIPAKYWHALGVSFLVATLAATISTTLGAVAALGIVRGRVRGGELLQAFFRLPLQIPFVVTGVCFLQFFYRLSDIGVDLLGTVAALVLAHVFITMPYGVGSVSAVLARAGTRLEEAAATLGAASWSIFLRVTLPQIKPGLFAAFFYAFIISFGDVPVAVFLVDQETMTLPVEIFQTLQFDFEPAVLAISTLVVLFSMLLIIAVQRLAGLNLVVPSNRR